MKKTSLIFTGISELVLPLVDEGSSRTPIRVIPRAGLWIENGKVRATGPENEIKKLCKKRAVKRIDLGGRAVVPGLVDSHTHIVFAGQRIDEFSRRAAGETYEEIAKAGGGILRSVEPLRAASQQDLVKQSLPRLQTMLNKGTTTCEIKSGYGLSTEAELKQLRAIRELSKHTPVNIVSTVLAHVIPKEALGDRQKYLQNFSEQVIQVAALKKLAQFADVFVETTAFNADEARQLARVAKAAGLSLKLHVDQLHPGQGAQLAAELQCVSADHLEMIDEPGRQALAKARTMATILPGCALFLGKGPWPNGRALRDAGCEVVVATDCNPGSSMVLDFPLCGMLAATHCGLSLEEALWGMTRGGAKALKLANRGCLAEYERADFVVIDHHDWRALLYYVGQPLIYAVYINGEKAWTSTSNSKKPKRAYKL